MLDSIKKRTSVRSYQKTPLSKEDKTFVRTVLNDTENLKGPFNHQARFFFLGNKTQEGDKVGTYGFIKHPPHFIGGVITNSFYGLIDYGFLFEHIILKLTERELGTVWLGGTFKRSQFDIEKKSNEIIPCVSPVGYSAKKSVREHVIRSVSKGDSRNAFNSLFFKKGEDTVIGKNHPYYDYLEAVRLAPSASNKQPWRIVLDTHTFHIFLKRSAGYGKSLSYDIQAVDCGIAMYHLVASIKADNHTVTYSKEANSVLKDAEYVISVHLEHA